MLHVLGISQAKAKIVVSHRGGPPIPQSLHPTNRYAAEYGDAVFAYLEGDKTDDSKRLMTRLGLRSVPTFFFLKGDETLEEFAGADDTVLKATIDKYI